MLNPFTAGQKLRAADDVAAHDITRLLHQDATQSSASTTFVSSTYLVFSIVSGASYVIEAQLFVDTNATADVKFNLLLPGGSTVRHSEPGGTSSTSTQWTFPGVAAGTVVSSDRSGFVDAGGTGTLTLQFGQVAASGSTILQVGSWVRLTRVV